MVFKNAIGAQDILYFTLMYLTYTLNSQCTSKNIARLLPRRITKAVAGLTAVHFPADIINLKNSTKRLRIRFSYSFRNTIEMFVPARAHKLCTQNRVSTPTALRSYKYSFEGNPIKSARKEDKSIQGDKNIEQNVIKCIQSSR